MKIFDNSEKNKEYYAELLKFVELQQKKPFPHKVADLIKEVAIEAIIHDKADVTGYCKNDGLGTVYIELTWRYEDEQ